MCEYSLEAPHLGASNEYTQHIIRKQYLTRYSSDLDLCRNLNALPVNSTFHFDP